MKLLLVKIFAVFFIAGPIDRVWAENIAVVMSSDAAAYQEALEGFRETTRHRLVGVQTLKDNPATWRDEIRNLRNTIEPDLVFVIGTSALQAVAGEITNIPVVHAMVFNPFAVTHSSSKNITGIGMIPSVNQSIALIKELNPKYRRIGVIYDPTRTGPLFALMRSAAQKENLQLVAREIRSVGEIGNALTSLDKEIDILWLWPDEGFLADDMLHRIFLFSFDRKVPVFGLSERHTEIGALLSLSYGSAKDMGRQAGEAANLLLADSAAAVRNIVPRQLKLTVNLKIAQKLGVEVPPSVARRADNGIKAPIYTDGDWWVFRIKTIYADGKTEVESHRVTFSSGKFDTQYPVFLTGGDFPGRPSFLPFASVHIQNAARNFLDFPLLPGKTWSFQYSRRFYGRNKATTAVAKAEVVGLTPHPVETPAGRFDAVEIYRTDQLTIPARSTYFYSPQTKSVVKLTAAIDVGDPRSSGRRFELELISYGIERGGKKDLR